MFKKRKKETETEADDFFGQNTETATAEEQKNKEQPSSLQSLENQPEWIDEEQEEGQLSVDVYQEGNTIIVRSTIAGVEPEDIDISLTNDMLTIRGERKNEKTIKEREFFFQECYWGSFSRSIILPVEVDAKKIDATIKNGILTIVLPKLETKTKKAIKVKDED